MAQVALQKELGAIYKELDSLEGGTRRAHLVDKVQEQVVHCLKPDTPQIILVTGPQNAGTLCSYAPLLHRL